MPNAAALHRLIQRPFRRLIVLPTPRQNPQHSRSTLQAHRQTRWDQEACNGPWLPDLNATTMCARTASREYMRRPFSLQ